MQQAKKPQKEGKKRKGASDFHPDGELCVNCEALL
jgi:hypothetical protein